MAEVFDNLKVSDKFVFMLDCKDGVPDHDVLAKTAILSLPGSLER